MSRVTVDIDGWEPDDVPDYDDDEFLAADSNLRNALQRYIDSGARLDNLVDLLEDTLAGAE
jgi:hypothetical protein